MKKVTKVIIFVLVFSALLSGFTGSDDEADTPEYCDSELVTDYKIMESEDISYSNVIRMSYRVVVPSDISEDELKSTLVHIVLEKTSENPDIDEISIFAYDDEDDIHGAYTSGMLEWCPYGDWGAITPEIAGSNDRSTYEYNIDVGSAIPTKESSNSQPTTTPETTTTPVYQDTEWLMSARSHMLVVGNDLSNYGEAASNTDFNSLSTYSALLFQDTQAALDDNKLYTVSPELQDMKNEYRLMMVNFNWAGFWTTASIEEINNGNIDQATEYLEQATESLNTGNEHLNVLNEQLQSYS